MNNNRLTDEEYGRALDNLAIACVDVAVTHGGKILLERRQNHPIQSEWWIFGGRMLKGEDLTDTAARSVSRELGLEVTDKARFKNIGTYNLVWPTRREPPQSGGCHHVLIAHQLEITSAEMRQLNTPEGAKWFELGEANPEFLPELNQILQNLQKIY